MDLLKNKTHFIDLEKDCEKWVWSHLEWVRGDRNISWEFLEITKMEFPFTNKYTEIINPKNHVSGLWEMIGWESWNPSFSRLQIDEYSFFVGPTKGQGIIYAERPKHLGYDYDQVHVKEIIWRVMPATHPDYSVKTTSYVWSDEAQVKLDKLIGELDLHTDYINTKAWWKPGTKSWWDWQTKKSMFEDEYED